MFLDIQCKYDFFLLSPMATHPIFFCFFVFVLPFSPRRRWPRVGRSSKRSEGGEEGEEEK